MKKGFTLIELLAVIVILAIIALIATPIILGIIDTARKNSIINSGQMYLASLGNGIYDKNLKESLSPSNCILSNGKTICDGVEIDVQMDGTFPSAANINYYNGKVISGCMTINDTNLEYQDNQLVQTSNTCDALVCDYGKYYIPATTEYLIDKDTDGLVCKGIVSDYYDLLFLMDPTMLEELKAEMGENVTDEMVNEMIAEETNFMCSSSNYISSLVSVFLEFDGMNEKDKRKNVEQLLLDDSITDENVRKQAVDDFLAIEKKIKDSKLFINHPSQSACLEEEYFIFDSSTGEVSGIKSPYNNIVGGLVKVPSEIGGVTVRKASGFNTVSSNLTLVLPNTITSIDDNAFKGNYRINKVVLPENLVSIGAYAFYRTYLSEIEIPDSVTSMADYAFAECKISKLKLGNGLTVIPRAAFIQNQIASVVIPEGVTTIGNASFAFNKLTSINIPSSVTKIDDGAFKDNQLTSVVIPDNVTELGINAFSSNQLASIKISNSITSIKQNTFSSNKLTSVTIPDSVKSIGMYAFSDNKIKNLDLGHGVSSIDQRAFKDNEIESLTLPSNVKSLSAAAFENNKISNLVLPNSSITYWDSPFVNNNLPDDQAFIYARKADGTEDRTIILSYGGAKKNIVIPEGVKELGETAFADHDLTSVKFPSTLIKIGDIAFLRNSIKEVKLPEGMKSIGERAFQDNQITNLVLPSTLTIIKGGAFSGNSLPDSQAIIYGRNADGTENKSVIVGYGGANKNVVIPSGVTTLGEMSFYSNKIESVVIPNTVTTIGRQAFANNRLTTVRIPTGVKRIEDLTFYGNQLTTVYVNKADTFIGNSNFEGATILENKE